MAFHGRKTIALITSDTTGSTSYENDIWTAANAAARARDVDLIVLAGSDFSDAARGGIANPRNMIYDLFRAEGFDGVVLSATTTCMGLDAAATARFIQRFDSLPFVMINGPKGKHRSLVDNKGGVYATIDHLIKAHGKKRIGYMRGPAGTEADERFAAYRQALADNGLAYDEGLVCIGNFTQSSGAAGAKELLENRKASFDAIGAANDAMAIGMIRGLRERGKRVPADIAVVGFDDIDGAAFHDPPLTTVHQPVYGQGYQAIEMVCDLIEGKNVPRDNARETEIIYRQSCGCALHGSSGGAEASIEASAWRADPSRESARAAAACGLRQADSAKARDLVARISEALAKDAGPDSIASACACFADAAAACGIDGSALRAWGKYLSELEKAFPALAASPSGAEKADILALRLELVLGEFMLRAEGQRKIDSAQNARSLRQLSQSIGMTYELGDILKVLDSELPKVGIPGYSLALMEKAAAVGEEGEHRLRQIRAMVDGARRDAADNGSPFPAVRLYRRDFFEGKRRSVVVYPLTFGSKFIGTVAMEADCRDGAAFDEIARQLSASLSGSQLMEGSRAAAERIAERAGRIEELVAPMIASLERVARLAEEKSEDVSALAEMARLSYRRLDGTIATIGRMSSGIGAMAELINAIDDISTTVNLVSLNASIEASHAGQFGKGFAVIAKEIKKLAESTQSKSAEISASISGILGNVRETTEAGQQCLDSYKQEELGVKNLIEIFEAITGDMQSLAADGRKVIATMQA